jgi:uncharacterized protein (TIGR01777 family)
VRRVVIAGSTGFIGSHLVKYFKGWKITTLDRRPNPDPDVDAQTWDGKNLGSWVQSLTDADVVVNLAGSPIAVKWDEASREKILSSRVDSTRAIGQALATVESAPHTWINGSAVGFYGDRSDTVLYESAPAGEGFLSEVCRAWEQAAEQAALSDVRLVLLRTGFVLGRDGGAFKSLKKLASFGLGGSVGSGDQWIPWIHVADLCRMFRWAAENERVSGPINGSAPEPVKNRDFMARLRHELKRPWAPPTPAFALKLVGEVAGPDSELLLGSQRAIPRAAIDNGFTWTYPNISEAIQNLTQTAKDGAFVA